MDRNTHATLEIEIDGGPHGTDESHFEMAEAIQRLFSGSGHWAVWKVQKPNESLIITDVIVTEQEEARERILQWNCGDVDQAGWNAFTGGLPNSQSVPGNKQGHNNRFIAINDGMRLYVPHSYQVPEMLPDGRILCDRRTLSKHNGNRHCQFAPRKGSNPSDYWTHSFYRIPNVTYRDEFTVDFSPSDGFDDVRAVLVDYHPGTFTRWKANASKSPPIGLYMIDGEFQLHVRGDKGVAGPADNEYDGDTTRIGWAFSPGTHTFAIEWRVNHAGPSSGIQNGTVSVCMDGDLKAEVTTPIGIDGGAAIPGALFSKFGAYEYSTERVGKLSVVFENLSIDVIEN